MGKYLVCIMILIAVMALYIAPAFSQSPATETTKAPASAPAQQETPKVSELSIYGEVQAVNTQANSMTVQYYDYDSDEEKSIEVTFDKDTKLENVKAMDEVKKADWVDVTYVSANGKNMAKTISVEKEEPAKGEEAPTAEE